MVIKYPEDKQLVDSAGIKIPASLLYAQELVSKTPEEMLSDALGKCMNIIVESNSNEIALQILQTIQSDLDSGSLVFLTNEEAKRRSVAKIADESKGDYSELDGPITQKQIGYIAGLTETLKLDRYNLPAHISPCKNYKGLTEGEAILVLNTLIAMKDAL